MNDILLKLHTLLVWRGGFKAWIKDVWLADGDEQECCNGYMCGCYGGLKYQKWQWMVKNYSPFRRFIK